MEKPSSPQKYAWFTAKWPLPEPLLNFLAELGSIGRFVSRFFVQLFHAPFEWQEFLRQCYWIGYRSLVLVGITSFIMGMVLTLQSRPTLIQFGAESWLPSMVSISVIREIGPVVTALICAGKIGSGIGAELGSMRVTEQIDAMEVSGTNPFKFIVVTRVLATTLMLPLLVTIGDAIALYGSFLGVNLESKITLTLFFSQAFGHLVFSDVVSSIGKSFFFGFAIGIVGCYKGYYSDKGTEGVGRSSNSAVVVASLMVFILDLIAVQVTNAVLRLIE
jgi:phospholipid/cholesterol/gamma-HCH transport system permease protein